PIVFSASRLCPTKGVAQLPPKFAGGLVTLVQLRPPSLVRSNAVQRPAEVLRHWPLPSAHPSCGPTKVRSVTWKACGTGPDPGPVEVGALEVALPDAGAVLVTGTVLVAAALVGAGVVCGLDVLAACVFGCWRLATMTIDATTPA